MSNPLNEKQVSDTRGDLPAGRELDALVAERVMGFWFEDDQWWTRHRDGQSRAYATAYLNIWGPNYASDGLPKFSTDIAAAWEVIAALDHRQIVTRISNDDCEIFYVEMWSRTAGYAYYPLENAVRASLNSAPHAICLAALKAVAS